MNKKIFGIAIAFLIAVILTTSVSAVPAQKVPIRIHWTSLNTIVVDTTDTGREPPNHVRHRIVLVNWSVVLDIDGVLGAETGFANNTVRKVTSIPGPDGRTMIFQETYDMKIDEANGGFEGSSLIMLDRVGGDYRAKAHGLLQGYGDFEGQTINAGHHWVGPGYPPNWNGTLLIRP